jgi:hypothetical protein
MMEIPIVTAIIAASVAAIGWVVGYVLTNRRDRVNQRLTASAKYLEQQLQELYGPLAMLVLEGRRTYRELLDVLGRDHVFVAGNPLEGNDLKTWLFWIEHDFFPRNERIKELIMSKTHLIEGESVPPSYLAFLDHWNSWKINHDRWRSDGIEYGWHSKDNWPEGFESDVVDTFVALKKKHRSFLVQSSML